MGVFGGDMILDRVFKKTGVRISTTKPLKTIVLAAVVGGALDYLYISASVYISGGSILCLWRYVASGLFGSSAYSMGIAGAVCGTPFSTSYS